MWAGYRNLLPRWRMFGLGMNPSQQPVVFLFRDDFITAEAAPLTSPRTAEPGPGTLNLTQVDAQLSISGGRIVIPTNTDWNELGWVDPTSRARTTGLGLYTRHLETTVQTCYFCHWNDLVDVSADNQGPGFYNNLSGNVLAIGNNGVPDTGMDVVADTEYQSFVVLRSVGSWLLMKGGTLMNWTLLYVTDETLTPLYARATFNKMEGNYDTFRVSQLPSPWDTDYGIATDRLAGIRSLGDTYTHEANFIGEYICTTVPAVGTMFWSFRRQDATNYWEVIIEPSQDITLREVVAGVPTARGTVAGVVNNGDRIVVIADGTTIRVYQQNTLRITYALAANFQTETSGEVLGVGNGRMDDIVTWPRQITGTALGALDRVANA